MFFSGNLPALIFAVRIAFEIIRYQCLNSVLALVLSPREYGQRIILYFGDPDFSSLLIVNTIVGDRSNSLCDSRNSCPALIIMDNLVFGRIFPSQPPNRGLATDQHRSSRLLALRRGVVGQSIVVQSKISSIVLSQMIRSFHHPSIIHHLLSIPLVLQH